MGEEVTMADRKTQRGNNLLTLQGFEYLFKRENQAGVKHWRCRHYWKLHVKCPATVKTTGPENRVVEGPTRHSHESDLLGDLANQAVQQTKAAAVVQAGVSTRAVVSQALEELDDLVQARMPSKRSIARVVNRARQQADAAPANPRNRDFEIPQEYQNLVLYDSGNDDARRFILLGNDDLFNQMKTDCWFGDGTFDVVPTSFFQLYTFHVKVGTSYPPCVYALLPGKTEQIYLRMTQKIKELLGGHSPQKILLDFEKGAMNACQSTFPASRLERGLGQGRNQFQEAGATSHCSEVQFGSQI